eukprot:TRINITY_DN6207_c0_g1_i5.p1 TRINITY_DN6207_c0_g1~~TRINITY_DN6207_c0_g1_i5.p1  ORF type:complete len:903 (+),score=291.59 TRINITY_DN6207_c0_g1_i5:87-2795(+)
MIKFKPSGRQFRKKTTSSEAEEDAPAAPPPADTQQPTPASAPASISPASSEVASQARTEPKDNSNTYATPAPHDDDAEADVAILPGKPRKSASSGVASLGARRDNRHKHTNTSTSRASGLLSFEENEDTSSPAASSSSTPSSSSSSSNVRGKDTARRPGGMKPFAVPPPTSTATHATSLATNTGEYTPEKMAELRKNAMQYRAPVKPTPTPTPPEIIDVDTLPDTAPVIIEVPDDDNDDAEMKDVAEEETGPSTTIPSSDHIRRVKDNRARRKDIVDTGFVSLSTDDASRHVREEDEDEEATEMDDYRGKKVRFGGVKKVYTPYFEDDDVANLATKAEDDEVERWEKEQIKKGAGGRMPGDNQDEDTAMGDGDRFGTEDMQSALPGLGVANRRINSSSILRDLKARHSQLRGTVSSHAQHLTRVQDEIYACNTSVESMKKTIDDNASLREFLLDMKEFVGDLNECLIEKTPFIDSLSERSDNAAKVRAGAARSRMDQMIRAEVISAEGKVVLDEFGRERKANEVLDKSDGWESDEGDTRETAEPPSEYAYTKEEQDDFKQDIDDIVRQGEQVMSDVSAPYDTILAIRERFEQWKDLFPAHYKRAYASLAAVTAFTPYVRLGLLAWDPLGLSRSAPPLTLDSMQWFKDLWDYGMKDLSAQAQQDDPDAQLMPSLVQKVVVPRVVSLLTHCYDARSDGQTTHMASLLNEVMIYLDAETKDVKDLRAALTVSLKYTVDGVERYRLPPVHGTNPQGGGGSPAAHKVCVRRLAKTIKLLHNVASWHTHMPRTTLAPLVFDSLLDSIIVPLLRNFATHIPVHDVPAFLTMAERIAAAIPRKLLDVAPTAGSGCPPEFGLLSSVLGLVLLNRKAPCPPELMARGVAVYDRLGDTKAASDLRHRIDQKLA